MDPKDILFPHSEIRPMQDKLVADVVETLKSQKHLIAHAPMGLGKSAASLSPAVKMAMDKGLNVFFMTPKHSQHQIVIETLQLIKNKYNLNLKAVDFIGKKWMCSYPKAAKMGTSEFMEFCKEQRDEEFCLYLKKATKDKTVLTSLYPKVPMHVEQFIEQCNQNGVCAYELSSILAKESSVIICDYFHIFSPIVRKSFLKRMDKELDNSILIIDEAHNLPDRIRSLQSSRLSDIGIKLAIREAEKYKLDNLTEPLEALRYCFEKLSNRIDSEEAEIKKEDISNALEYDYQSLCEALEEAAKEIRDVETKSYCGGVASFLTSWLGEDHGFCRLVKKDWFRGKPFISVEYNCLDPSLTSKSIFDDCFASVIMSGTLTPTFMYKDLLGLEKNRTVEKEYPSPFPPKNRLSLIIPEITTKYSSRSEAEFTRIAKECANICKSVPRNTAAFFPSYDVLNKVLPFFRKMHTGPIFVERTPMIKEEKKQMLADFKNSADGSVLFGVQGANFAEGVNIPNNKLQAVILVGVPLSRPNLTTKSLIDYYQKEFGKGWEYGYLYPAMSKSLQAAGRCIRSEKDRGVIVFMDDRFSQPTYLNCIPKEWMPMVTKLASERIKKFFS